MVNLNQKQNEFLIYLFSNAVQKVNDFVPHIFILLAILLSFIDQCIKLIQKNVNHMETIINMIRFIG